jgi:hypothetical protein
MAKTEPVQLDIQSKYYLDGNIVPKGILAMTTIKLHKPYFLQRAPDIRLAVSVYTVKPA